MSNDNDRLPEILKPLWSGESVWCANCGHHLNCHQTGRVPLCDYDASGSNGSEKGRIECNCDGFVGVQEDKIR